MAVRIPLIPRLSFAAEQQMHRHRHFIGVRGAPRNNTFQLIRIVRDGADLKQLGFDSLQVSHGKFSIADPGAAELEERGSSERQFMPGSLDQLLRGERLVKKCRPIFQTQLIDTLLVGA